MTKLKEISEIIEEMRDSSSSGEIAVKIMEKINERWEKKSGEKIIT